MIDYTTNFQFSIYNQMIYSQITAFDLFNEGKFKTHIPPICKPITQSDTRARATQPPPNGKETNWWRLNDEF